MTYLCTDPDMSMGVVGGIQWCGGCVTDQFIQRESEEAVKTHHTVQEKHKTETNQGGWDEAGN